MSKISKSVPGEKYFDCARGLLVPLQIFTSQQILERSSK